ncbi:MAG: kelch repeat-containing protein [Gemmatimonadales bacterium]
MIRSIRSPRLVRSIVTGAGLIASCSGVVRAQGSPLDSIPTGLSLVGAAFDEARGRLVVVGGNPSAATTSATWEWDGTNWTLVTTGGPSARSEPLLVYDRARRRIVLYGGDRGAEPPATDTWSWDGHDWRRLATTGPSPRAASMVFDAGRDRIVLFGGGGPSGELHNDTWEWNGDRWNLVIADSQAGSPPPRALFGLAYDARRGVVVLTAGFGGFNPATRQPALYNDTWEWDGRTWHQVDIPGPGARDHLAMVYDPERAAILLHGGGSPQAGLQGDTWSYDGTRWTPLLDGGPKRGRHRLIDDPRGRRILLYGGWAPDNQQMSDLWALGAHESQWMQVGR